VDVGQPCSNGDPEVGHPKMAPQAGAPLLVRTQRQNLGFTFQRIFEIASEVGMADFWIGIRDEVSQTSFVVLAVFLQVFEVPRESE
jgi:hypothetical protein